MKRMLRTTFRGAIIAALLLLLALAQAPFVSASGDATEGRGAATNAVATLRLSNAPDGEAAPISAGVQMTHGDDRFWDSRWWIVMPIMMAIFWGAVIAVVVWGVRQFTKGRNESRSPLDIAKERLARGEISKEEFDRIRVDLV